MAIHDHTGRTRPFISFSDTFASCSREPASSGQGGAVRSCRGAPTRVIGRSSISPIPPTGLTAGPK